MTQPTSLVRDVAIRWREPKTRSPVLEAVSRQSFLSASTRVRRPSSPVGVARAGGGRAGTVPGVGRSVAGRRCTMSHGPGLALPSQDQETSMAGELPLGSFLEPGKGVGELQTLGAWLRGERLARKWSIAEMGRQLHKTAKAASDNTVASTAILTTYVRRWEHDKFVPTGRYRLHYCTTLGIPPTRFGPEHSALRTKDAAPLAEMPPEDIWEPECVVVVIPAGCRRIVIDMTSAGTRDAPKSGRGL